MTSASKKGRERIERARFGGEWERKWGNNGERVREERKGPFERKRSGRLRGAGPTVVGRGWKNTCFESSEMESIYF